MAGRLGDILVSRGLISKEDLQAALSSQGGQRGMLGEILVARGFINSQQLGEALSVQFDVPYQPIARDAVNPQVVRLLPESLARQRLMAPITVNNGRMTLAMVAPDDMGAISEAELISGYQVEPVVALRSDVLAALDRGFDERISARQTAVDIKLQELEQAKSSQAANDSQKPKTRTHRSCGWCDRSSWGPSTPAPAISTSSRTSRRCASATAWTANCRRS